MRNFLIILSVFLNSVVLLADINDDLLNAVEQNNLEEIKMLIDKGAEINTRDETGNTPLLRTLINIRFANTLNTEQYNIVKYLVEHGADINAKNKFGFTPLTMAIDPKCLELVIYLVEHGAEINVKNEYNNTPLMEAVRLQAVDIAKFLVNQKADINITNIDGENALSLAIRDTMKQMIYFLIENGANLNDGLLEAIKQNDIDLVNYLLSKGANINAKRYSKTGRISCSSHLITKEGFKFLCSDSFSNGRMSGGLSLLLTEPKDTIIIEYLANKRISDRNIRSYDALQSDTNLSLLEYVKFLIYQGNDLYTEYGWNGLIYAASNGNLEMVRYLIENDASVNYRTPFGVTALLEAVKNNHIDIVEYLISHCANVNIETKFGRTLISYALNDEMKHLLMEYQTKLDNPNDIRRKLRH